MWTYHGGGYGGALPGVPARDLTNDEVKAALEVYDKEDLLKLYKPPAAKKAKSKTKKDG